MYERLSDLVDCLPVSQGIWKCKGLESGTEFSEVDLSEREWTDYDEKVGMQNRLIMAK